MNVLICDDDMNFAHLLANDFSEFFKNKIRLMNLDILDSYFEKCLKNKYDLCFMDIDLVSQNGINLVKQLKINNEDIIIIFISAREDLVFDTFSVEPFQFIRKNHYKFDIDNVFTQLEWKLEKYFVKVLIKENKRNIGINPKDIITVISIGHDIIINTNKKTFYTTGTLKKFYEDNKNTTLIQIQKNLIINLDKIISVESSTVHYIDEKEYVIGRVYKKIFNKKYEEYLYL